MAISSGVTQLGVWLCIGLVLVSAAVVVTIRNLFRAALSLGLVLVGVAALFLLLEAEFLAFVQILIYVGAILTLVIFAVMLIPPAAGGQEGGNAPLRTAGTRGVRQASGVVAASARQGPAALLCLALFVLLSMTTGTLAGLSAPVPEAVSLAALGKELVTSLVLPFEVISLVFVAALIGAVIVAYARKEPAPPTASSTKTPV